MRIFPLARALVVASALTTLASPLMADGLFETRLIAPEGTYPANHGSTIVALSDAERLACWFAGSDEAQRDVEIVCSRRDSASAEWAAPYPAVRRQERAEGSLLSNKFVGNPVLHLDEEGILWLFYEAVQIGGHSGAGVHYKISRDRGVSWSTSHVLAGGLGDFGHLPRNKPLALGAGRILLPVYREFTSTFGYTLLLTLENGRITSKSSQRIPGEDHGQPSLVRTGTDEVLAYLRVKEAKNVLVSRLSLTTLTWSTPVATNLPNPDAAVDATLDTDGRVVIAYNDSTTTRNPLSIAVSTDGEAFTKLVDLENTPGESFGYPALIRAPDGAYEVTYTYRDKVAIKHARFDDAWLSTR